MKYVVLWIPIVLAATGGVCDARDGIVAILFDDGRAEHATYAAPLLEAHGFKGTFGVIAGHVDKRAASMTSQDVRSLARRGHEIVDHTLHHHPEFWGNREHASEWEDTTQRSLAIFHSMGINPAGWDQPGGDGQGFDAGLRAVLARHYRYSVGRVGMDWTHQTNFHWNQRDDLFSLGRGGVYSYGYNAPGEPHAAEIRAMIQRIADGYAQGLVMVPAFHALTDSDSSRIALEKVCRFLSDNGIPVVRWGEAVDRVLNTGDFIASDAEQIPNPDFRFDRDANGRPDGWHDVEAAPGFVRARAGAFTDLYGPSPGRSVLRLRARTASVPGFFFVELRILRVDGSGTYSAETHRFDHTAATTWRSIADTLQVPDDADRVRIAFGGFSGRLNVREVSWRLADPETARVTSPPPIVIGLNQYPNPFRDWTRIVYDTPRETSASLGIYDARGRRVRQLVQRRLNAGRHEFVWNGRNTRGTRVAAGVYFCRYRALDESIVRRMIVLP